jgi:hypothetical protein
VQSLRQRLGLDLGQLPRSGTWVTSARTEYAEYGMGAAQRALLDGRLVEFGVGSLWVLQGERLGMLFIIIIIAVAM